MTFDLKYLFINNLSSSMEIRPVSKEIIVRKISVNIQQIYRQPDRRPENNDSYDLLLVAEA